MSVLQHQMIHMYIALPRNDLAIWSYFLLLQTIHILEQIRARLVSHKTYRNMSCKTTLLSLYLYPITDAINFLWSFAQRLCSKVGFLVILPKAIAWVFQERWNFPSTGFTLYFRLALTLSTPVWFWTNIVRLSCDFRVRYKSVYVLSVS
jgi:hypothetical protein